MATATAASRANEGLEGVVVAQTALSDVDGEAGRLVVRGRRIEELAGRVPFEEMARLLWEGLAPSAGQPAASAAASAVPGAPSAADLAPALGLARAVAYTRVAPLLPAAAALPAIAALRLGLASLRPGTAAGAAGPPDHLLATAAVPVFACAFARHRRGVAPLPPDPALGHAADLLRMLRGEPASAAEASALDAYLVTVAEHGMNASTFTARVVASTRAGVLPAVIAALCALEGPLHGGAPGPVLDMLDALAGPEDAGAWIAAELAAGRRLMGFGHRIYRVRDPRTDVLKDQVARLRRAAADGAARPPGTARPRDDARPTPAGQGAGAAMPGSLGAGDPGSRLALAEQVEREALAALAALRPGRRLDTNVEFYTAVLLDALRIDRDLFTSVFAAGRVAGWTAHVFEQERANRLIRPQSEYVGPRPGHPARPAPPARPAI
jgi:citrate synthase